MLCNWKFFKCWEDASLALGQCLFFAQAKTTMTYAGIRCLAFTSTEVVSTEMLTRKYTICTIGSVLFMIIFGDFCAAFQDFSVLSSFSNFSLHKWYAAVFLVFMFYLGSFYTVDMHCLCKAVSTTYRIEMTSKSIYRTIFRQTAKTAKRITYCKNLHCKNLHFYKRIRSKM